MFAVWNYMSCRFLIVELVRGVKKFIFVCLVTSCYVLSMFQQLRWDFYNDRKYFAHKSVIKWYINTYITRRLMCRINSVCIWWCVIATCVFDICVCVCVRVMNWRTCSAVQSHLSPHFLPFYHWRQQWLTHWLSSSSFFIPFSLTHIHTHQRTRNHQSSVRKILKALTFLLFGVIECLTTLSLSLFHSLVLPPSFPLVSPVRRPSVS